MESNWAAEHLQVIRTLMERSALYRRALAPVMIFNGVLGVAGGAVGWACGISSGPAFVAYWEGVAISALAGSFLLVRRQALKDAEPFWSPPTRRVGQALLPPLLIGAAAGVLECLHPRPELVAVLPAFWMLLYGCALNAAGFFMPRGIKLLGWIFIVCGCGWMGVCATCTAERAWSPTAGHALMGGVFGGLHLAHGIYLYFTEPRGNEP